MIDELPKRAICSNSPSYQYENRCVALLAGWLAGNGCRQKLRSLAPRCILSIRIFGDCFFINDAKLRRRWMFHPVVQARHECRKKRLILRLLPTLLRPKTYEFERVQLATTGLRPGGGPVIGRLPWSLRWWCTSFSFMYAIKA